MVDGGMDLKEDGVVLAVDVGIGEEQRAAVVLPVLVVDERAEVGVVDEGEILDGVDGVPAVVLIFEEGVLEAVGPLVTEGGVVPEHTQAIVVLLAAGIGEGEGDVHPVGVVDFPLVDGAVVNGHIRQVAYPCRQRHARCSRELVAARDLHMHGERVAGLGDIGEGVVAL